MFHVKFFVLSFYRSFLNKTDILNIKLVKPTFLGLHYFICILKASMPLAFFNLSGKMQGRSEGTASVAFKVLIIDCHIEFIKLFIFNCVMSNFCFTKNISFTRSRERLFMEVRPQFQISISPGKMMTCYLQDTDTFLRYRTLCTRILKCGIPTRGIKLTGFVLFEVLGEPQL